MHSRRIAFLSAGLCIGLASASSIGWLMAADAEPVAPSWIDHPKSDDSIFLYRIGRADGQDNKAAAQQAAYQNALSVIVGEMLARAGVEERLRSELAANLPVQNAEIVPGAVYTETNATGVICWVQVSYPLSEKTKLLERIEPEKEKVLARMAFDRRIADLFAEAQAALSRGEYELASTNLQEVIRNYAKVRAPAFEIQEAQMLLGDTYQAQKEFLKARQCYEAVLQNSASSQWKIRASAKLKTLPKAPRAWPLYERWGGRKIALLCGMRNVGQIPRPYAALAGVLSRDCREAALECVDVAGDLSADDLAALFSQHAIKSACEAAKRKGASMIVAVMLTTDPAKRGQTKETMGVAMPVADADAAFLIVDVDGANILYGDQFNEFSGTRSEAQFSERVASMLIDKYLIPKCPTLAR